MAGDLMAPKPMREAFRVREMGDRVALLDERDGRVHLLDPVATAVWRLADGLLSDDDLILLVARTLGETVTADDIRHALCELESAGVMEHENAPTTVSRRSVLAAAALAPAMLTIGSIAAAPPAAAASTVVLCHNGKTIRVSPNAVADHLRHGDTLGACGATTTAAPTTTGAPTTTMGPNPTTTSTTPGPNPTTTMGPNPTTTRAP